MDVDIHFYGWRCVRCEYITAKVKVGVSSEGNLIGMWKCPSCSRSIIAEITLAKVIADVPSSPEEKLAQEQRKVILDQDFLRGVGIRID